MKKEKISIENYVEYAIKTEKINENLFTFFLSILYDIRSSLQIKATNIELLEYILQINVDKLRKRYSVIINLIATLFVL